MAWVEVDFPGGKRVDATIAGYSVPTDQSQRRGGDGGAPEPFQLFLASIATCAGIYAKSFCDERELTAPLRLEMEATRGDEGVLSRLDFALHVAPDFPAKYDKAIERSMELCAVKKQLREEIQSSIRIVRRAPTR